MEMLIRDLLTFSRTIQRDDRDMKELRIFRTLSRALTLLDDRMEETSGHDHRA